MAVFKVVLEKNFSIIPNEIMRDGGLPPQARCILQVMLSLPSDWNYTAAGISAIANTGITCTRKALKDMEKRGYLVRTRIRNDKGRIIDVKYDIFEVPLSEIEIAKCNDELYTAEEIQDFLAKRKLGFAANVPEHKGNAAAKAIEAVKRESAAKAAANYAKANGSVPVFMGTDEITPLVSAVNNISEGAVSPADFSDVSECAGETKDGLFEATEEIAPLICAVDELEQKSEEVFAEPETAAVEPRQKMTYTREELELKNAVKSGFSLFAYPCVDFPHVENLTQQNINNTKNVREKETRTGDGNVTLKRRPTYNEVIDNFTVNDTLRNLLRKFTQQVCVSRKRHGTFLTNASLEMLLTKLKELSETDNEMIAIVKHSIERGYDDFYSLPKSGRQNSRIRWSDKPQFDFEQHTYDFDALEKELLAN